MAAATPQPRLCSADPHHFGLACLTSRRCTRGRPSAVAAGSRRTWRDQRRRARVRGRPRSPTTGKTLDAELAAAGVKARARVGPGPGGRRGDRGGPRARRRGRRRRRRGGRPHRPGAGAARPASLPPATSSARPTRPACAPMSAPAPSGEERWWQGSAEAVGRAVRETQARPRPRRLRRARPGRQRVAHARRRPPAAGGARPRRRAHPVDRRRCSTAAPSPWASPPTPARRPRAGAGGAPARTRS